MVEIAKPNFHAGKEIIRAQDDKIARLERENAELRERLQISPQGDDAIDAAESAADFLRHRAETAERQLAEAKAELARMREAMKDATAHLVGAADAYHKHASRHKSLTRATADPFFTTRSVDFKRAAERARAALSGSGDGGWPVPEGYALVPVDRAKSILDAFDKATAEPMVALANYGDLALSLLRGAVTLAVAPAQEVAK